MNKKKHLDKRKIGLNLYRLISNSSFTRESIAEYLELDSPRVIYDWTGGKKIPSVENLYNLSVLLDVSIEDILT